MPFPYETSGQPVRVRKSKDKDSRSTASSSGGRKQKHASESSNRSPPQSDRSSQLSIYTQDNPTLDQLPALPESGTASPGSAASPVLRESFSAAHVPSSTSITYHHTPVALQKYLQTEADEEQEDSDKVPSRKPPSEVQRVKTSRAGIETGSRGGSVRSEILDSHTSTPLATSVREYPEPVYDRSDPSFFSQPHDLQRSISSRSSSSRTREKRPYTTSSPPPRPPSFSPSLGQAPSAQSGFDLRHAQQQPQFEYLASPPPFASVIPFNSGAPSEPYFPSAYPTPQHYPMIHPADPRTDFHHFSPQHTSPYLQYVGPVHNQDPLSPMHHAPARGHTSPSFGMNTAAEPVPLAQFTANSLEKTPSFDSPGQPRKGAEEEAAELLQRIQVAIPDLHLLVNRYRETSDQLGVREQIIREKEAQRTAELKQREIYIEKLGKDLEDVKAKYSAESSKLRLEIGNMEEKHKELQERASAEQKAKDEMQLKNRDQAAEMARMVREHDEDSARLMRDLDAWKRKATQDTSALRDDLQRQRQELETASQAQLGKISRIHAQEKDTLHSALAQCKKDAEGHAHARQAMEKVADTRQKAIDDSRRQHAEEKHSWEKERQTMNRRWDEERVALGKGSEEQRKILIAQHESEKGDIRKSYEKSEARLRKQAQEDMANLQEEVGRLKAGWDADKTKFSRVIADLKASAARLDEENKKLQRLTDAFGEVTDLRSRGDPY